MLALWVVGGLVTLCGALSLAELAAALPETGGFYAYLREGWGRQWAFCFGWSELVLIRASALGGIAVVFGEYLLRSLGVDPVEHYIAARALSAARHRLRRRAPTSSAPTSARRSSASRPPRSSPRWCVLVGASFLLGGGHGASLSPPDRGGAGTDWHRRDGPGAGQRAVGLRRLGRSVVRRRRGEGSAAEPASRDHPRHARAHRASTC